MKFVNTPIEGLVIIEPTVFKDDRGYFLESYNKKKLEKAIGNISFVQDNESKSSTGVLRGLHFQKPPCAQVKLVRCIEGKVLDNAVDIREGSDTYGEHVSVELSAENKKQVFIPRGFAHGFLVLSESAIIAYKVDTSYVSAYDEGIRLQARRPLYSVLDKSKIKSDFKIKIPHWRDSLANCIKK